jgi:hypothetical protein
VKIRNWIGALAVSLVTVAYADYQQPNAPSSGTAAHGSYTRGEPRQVTPEAGPRVAHGADAFITADFIWWKPTQQGLEYASSGVINNLGESLTTRGNVHSPNFSFTPGFKVGLGVNLPYDGWDLTAEYTWIRDNHNKDTVSKSNGNISPSVFIGSNLITPQNIASIGDITRAVCHWDFRFNVIDAELGRSHYISQHLILRPFIGLKGTWQTHIWKANYTANSVTANGSTSSGTARMYQNHQLWGIGARSGLDTTWNLTDAFSIFGNFALSAVWTDYSVDRDDTFQPANTDGAEIVRTHDGSYYVKNIVEFQLGMMGQWWFSNDDYHLAVSLGYDQQVWINYGNFIYLIDNGQADLSLHGLTLKFRFDF